MTNRKSLTPLEVVVIATVVLALIAILYPMVRSQRLAAERVRRHYRLRAVGMGLHNFNDAYQMPSAVRRDKSGRALCSWRLQILPFMEAMLGIDFSDRWDNPANEVLINIPISYYCFPPDMDSLNTNVAAITGPGTAFDEDHVVSVLDLDHDTILVVEIADSSTHWAEPGGDLSIGNVPESIVRGVDGTGFNVLFADGAVWFLKADVPLENVEKFFTIDGAERYDRDELLAPYADTE